MNKFKLSSLLFFGILFSMSMVSAAYNLNCIPVNDQCVYDDNGNIITYASVGATPPTGSNPDDCVNEFGDYAIQNGKSPPGSSAVPAGTWMGFPGIVYTSSIKDYTKDWVFINGPNEGQEVPNARLTDKGIALWDSAQNAWVKVGEPTSTYNYDAKEKDKLRYNINYVLKFTCSNHPPYKVMHAVGIDPSYSLSNANLISVPDPNDPSLTVSVSEHFPNGKYVFQNTLQGSLGPITISPSYIARVGRHATPVNIVDFSTAVVFEAGWYDLDFPNGEQGYLGDQIFPLVSNSFCIENDKEGGYAGNWFIGQEVILRNGDHKILSESDLSPNGDYSPYQVFGSVCTDKGVPLSLTSSTSPPTPTTLPLIYPQPPILSLTIINNFFNWIYPSTTTPIPPPVTPITLDPSTGQPQAVCGNGISELPNEQCDNGDATHGAGNGQCINGVLCSATCQASGCGGQVLVCNNNGVAEGVESCDVNDFKGLTCPKLDSSFSGGNLACTNQCNINTAGCTKKPPVEVCYGDLNCALKSFCGPLEREVLQMDAPSNALMSIANTNPSNVLKVCCTLPVAPSGGSGSGTVACGNGIRESTEQCDGLDLNGKNCLNYKAGSTFDSGTLRCNPLGGDSGGAACTFDASLCTTRRPPVAVWTNTKGEKIDSAHLGDVVLMKVNGFDVPSGSPNAEFRVYKKGKDILTTSTLLYTDRKPVNTNRIATTSSTNDDGSPRTLKNIVGLAANLNDILYFETRYTSNPPTPNIKTTGGVIDGSPEGPIRSNDLLILDTKCPPGGCIEVASCYNAIENFDLNNPTEVFNAEVFCKGAYRKSQPQDADLSCTDTKAYYCEWTAGVGGKPPTCSNKVVDINGAGETVGECVYKTTNTGICKDGRQVIDITIIRKSSSGVGGSGSGIICDKCVAKSTLGVPCGRSVLLLPFFGAWQFIITILIIIAIYYLITRKKIGKKRKK